MHGHHHRQYQTNAVATSSSSPSTENSPRGIYTPSPARHPRTASRVGTSTVHSLMHSSNILRNVLLMMVVIVITRQTMPFFSSQNGYLISSMNSSTNFRASVSSAPRPLPMRLSTFQEVLMQTNPHHTILVNRSRCCPATKVPGLWRKC